MQGGRLVHPRQPSQTFQVTTGHRVTVRYLPPHFTVTLPGGVPLPFVLVPAGSFTMGTADPRELADPAEPRPTPPHPVTLDSAYYLARTPTTEAQWAALAGVDPTRRPVAPDCVATEVSYEDIQTTFLPALERHAPGRGFRLPSEAEWEFACRAGTRTRYFFGDDDAQADRYFRMRAHPDRDRQVGTLQPNPWGLFDLAGLCMEWCEDIAHRTYDGAPADGSPWIEPVGNFPNRILRGGPAFLGQGRSAKRYAEPPRWRHFLSGFRLKASEPGIGDLNS
jgi:formylglycine-generating enzyme required for sulfatase activity